jgi:hypothetical protein
MAFVDFVVVCADFKKIKKKKHSHFYTALSEAVKNTVIAILLFQLSLRQYKANCDISQLAVYLLD